MAKNNSSGSQENSSSPAKSPTPAITPTPKMIKIIEYLEDQPENEMFKQSNVYDKICDKVISKCSIDINYD